MSEFDTTRAFTPEEIQQLHDWLDEPPTKAEPFKNELPPTPNDRLPRQW